MIPLGCVWRRGTQWLGGGSVRRNWGLTGIEVSPASVETNIVLFGVRTMPALDLARELEAAGVRVLATGRETIRAVTNLMVTREAIAEALKIIGKVLSKSGRT